MSLHISSPSRESLGLGRRVEQQEAQVWLVRLCLERPQSCQRLPQQTEQERPRPEKEQGLQQGLVGLQRQQQPLWPKPQPTVKS